MNLTISNIQYSDLASSNARLISFTIPREGETFVYMPQAGIDALSYDLSDRNGSNAYNLPTQKEKVYLNFVPRKVIVSDSNMREYLETEFTFFKALEIIPPDPFSLPEGQIFRCFNSDSVPLAKESYVYWIIEDGKKKLIPNYKTLEVMLNQRNATLLSVRLVPENQCEEIELFTGSIPDKSSSWSEEMKDKTNAEALAGMEATVAEGAALAAAASASAGAQIAVVQAQAEASKAEADAAKAEAEAAKAASDAAIAEAEASKAASELAILNATS